MSSRLVSNLYISVLYAFMDVFFYGYIMCSLARKLQKFISIFSIWVPSQRDIEICFYHFKFQRLARNFQKYFKAPKQSSQNRYLIFKNSFSLLISALLYELSNILPIQRFLEKQSLGALEQFNYIVGLQLSSIIIAQFFHFL